jgi:hypothetical protein
VKHASGNEFYSAKIATVKLKIKEKPNGATFWRGNRYSVRLRAQRYNVDTH